jgi:hypothetical protein
MERGKGRGWERRNARDELLVNERMVQPGDDDWRVDRRPAGAARAVESRAVNARIRNCILPNFFPPVMY